MELPHSRFPGYFLEGSTNRETPVVASVLGWGNHGRVVESIRDPDKNPGRFIPLYSRQKETWIPAKPVPAPLLPPNADCRFAPVTESDLVYKKTKYERHTKPDVSGVTLAFSKQIGNFCWDHNSIAFQCMGRLLEPHCHLGDSLLTGNIREHSKRMTSLMQCLQSAPYQDCPFAHANYLVRSFSYFTRDWLQDVPPELLAELVNDGMTEDWKALQFQASLTGGALTWMSYPGTPCGCLIYPRGAAMNKLYFQQVLLDESDELGVKLQGDAAIYELKERIQQVSAGRYDQMMVGVRSSFHLASWSFSAQDPPKLLSILSTKNPSTCINASPHIAAEFCVCTEGGSLYLWSVETGLQQVRQDSDTLFFRDDPYWRWSDFTSHPRVLTFADRTGVQFADIRVPNSQGQELFRIGQESSCQKGERVILPRCLWETNPAHCLVSTQFSLYIMDERFPLVPLAKWDHMLEGPPTYINVIPGGATDGTNKILLGTQHSQETLMVQYSDRPTSPFQLLLPALCLPRISESLAHLSPLLPHRHDAVLQRLRSPLAGLATASSDQAGDQLQVFQLTADGDLFIQKLLQDPSDTPSDTFGVRVGSSVCPSILEEPAADSSHQSVSANEAVIHPTRAKHQGSPSTHPSCLIRASSTTSFSRFLHDFCKAYTWRGTFPRPRYKIHNLLPEKMSKSIQEASGLREQLRLSMKQGTLVPSMVTPSSPQLEAFRPESWKDPLSQRLTASWEGKLELWWDDCLGTNRESKIRALREKRRRQKLLRSRSRSTLSGSFTSSIVSDPYETEASSPKSCDAATDDLSLWSSTNEDCAFDASQVKATSSQSLNSPAFMSSQSLRAKGIPHEKRHTLRNFFSLLETSSVHDPGHSGSQSQTLSQPIGDCTSTGPESAPTGSQSQTLSQRSGGRTSTGPESALTGSQSQTLSQRSGGRISTGPKSAPTGSQSQSLSQCLRARTSTGPKSAPTGSQSQTLSKRSGGRTSTGPESALTGSQSQTLPQRSGARTSTGPESALTGSQSQTLPQRSGGRTSTGPKSAPTGSQSQSLSQCLGARTSTGPESALTGSQSQTLSQRSGARTSTGPESALTGSQSQTLSQRSQPPSKRFRMGF
ncbi:TATA box-binding protein-associated factor RNA polymerase I subunit C-like isoform 1-T2 [Leptodactylus fuscus]|uniref:TATA box-binding protein-associated factor RNA polymerase I subunit C-like n=1 Tax=Leptodactylus fuscus TaxID=238119 RepID=UPI003F4E598B